MSIVVVLIPSSKAIETLRWANGHPQLFRVSSGHLALEALDEVSQYVIFDGPMGVLDCGPYDVRLLDLEEGIERAVRREDINTAIAMNILERF